MALGYRESQVKAAVAELVADHPDDGADLVAKIPGLEVAATIVRYHHERWDGQGYPDGLEGDAIPLAARVFAVADALDALTTDRPYRPASSFGDARHEVLRGAGSQFDPVVVAAYRQIPDRRFEALREGEIVLHVPDRDARQRDLVARRQIADQSDDLLAARAHLRQQLAAAAGLG